MMHFDFSEQVIPVTINTLKGEYSDPKFCNATIRDEYKRYKELLGNQIISATSTSADIETEVRPKEWDISSWFIFGDGPAFQIANRSPSITEEPALQQKSTIELIAYIRKHLNVPFAERLANRLSFLVEISEEEYPEQEPLSPQSLQTFIGYLECNNNLAYPNVVLTKPGNIRVQWRKAQNQHFAVEFLGNGDVRFVVFAPDQKRPYKTDRVAGLAGSERLMELVKPYGVHKWVHTT